MSTAEKDSRTRTPPTTTSSRTAATTTRNVTVVPQPSNTLTTDVIAADSKVAATATTSSSTSTSSPTTSTSSSPLLPKPRPKRTREGNAYSFGSPFIFGLLLLIVVLVRSTRRNILRTNQIREFQIIYCSILSIFLLWNHHAHVTFFQWFSKPTFSFGQRRGLGHHPVSPFSFIPTFKLTINQFRCVGYLLALSLFLSCFHIHAIVTRICLVLSFLLYFLYFTQLWCETKAGGHGSLTIPPVLLILALSPDLSSLSTTITTTTTVSVWPLRLIQIILCMQYCASGVCKLLASIAVKRWWCSGSVLQYYLYDAMWSRPGGEWSQYLMVRFVFLK